MLTLRHAPRGNGGQQNAARRSEKGARHPAARRRDLHREVTDRIRSAEVDVILNLTAGMGGDLVFGSVEAPLPVNVTGLRSGRASVAGTRMGKPAAILVADIAGYSRLAGADEDRILARLRTLRRSHARRARVSLRPCQTI
jgi:uncharacterized protein (DUF849 family)